MSTQRANHLSGTNVAFLRLLTVVALSLVLANSTAAAEAVSKAAAGSAAKGSAAKGSAAKGSAAKEQGFVPLLGDDARNHWRGYKSEEWPANWELKNGVLTRVGSGGDIMTSDQFADFELRLDWKISKGGNSGIIYRVSTGDDQPYISGIECQVLDDEMHADGKFIKHTAASLYGLYERDPSVKAAVEKWNSARVIVNGNHVEHWLNGKKVVECEIGSDDWNEKLAASKFSTWPKFAKNRQGHIAFQDHGDAVWYRNVRIKRLNAKK